MFVGGFFLLQLRVGDIDDKCLISIVCIAGKRDFFLFVLHSVLSYLVYRWTIGPDWEHTLCQRETPAVPLFQHPTPHQDMMREPKQPKYQVSPFSALLDRSKKRPVLQDSRSRLQFSTFFFSHLRSSLLYLFLSLLSINVRKFTICFYRKYFLSLMKELLKRLSLSNALQQYQFYQHTNNLQQF